MAAVAKAIGLQIRNIRIDDDNADKSFTLVKHLHSEPGWYLTDSGIDKFARVHFTMTEAQADFGGGIEMGEHVRHDAHLRDALHDYEASVLAPLPVGEEAVDGAVHVT